MQSNSSIPAVNHYCRRGKPGKPAEGSPTQTSAGYFRWKVAIDLIIASLLLIPAGAMIAILVLLVRLTSKGPGIYQQLRVGKRGRRFTMYKIRTMTADAEVKSGPVWTQPGDPRVTLVGRILRKLHLDELPQIFNVLRGEMSFVGPRPERPEFVCILSEAIPRYRDRSAVRPGITGLAQINLPPDSDLTSVRRKVVLDLDYIEHGNLWLDVRLLFCTALRIVKVDEGFLTWILGLRRPHELVSLEASIEVQPRPEEATPETILWQAAQATMSQGMAGETSASEPKGITSKKPR